MDWSSRPTTLEADFNLQDLTHVVDSNKHLESFTQKASTLQARPKVLRNLSLAAWQCESESTTSNNNHTVDIVDENAMLRQQVATLQAQLQNDASSDERATVLALQLAQARNQMHILQHEVRKLKQQVKQQNEDEQSVKTTKTTKSWWTPRSSRRRPTQTSAVVTSSSSSSEESLDAFRHGGHHHQYHQYRHASSVKQPSRRTHHKMDSLWN